jgi:hypothetical protein
MRLLCPPKYVAGNRLLWRLLYSASRPGRDLEMSGLFGNASSATYHIPYSLNSHDFFS